MEVIPLPWELQQQVAVVVEMVLVVLVVVVVPAVVAVSTRTMAVLELLGKGLLVESLLVLEEVRVVVARAKLATQMVRAMVAMES
jgi:Mg2+/Co2+ transporter CorB